MNQQIKQKLHDYSIVISFPVGMLIIMELICFCATGNHLIVSSVDFNSFVRNIFIMTCSGIALSLGMRSARMDFSLGAQRLIACLIGANIAIKLGLSGFAVMIFAIIFGILAGLVSGLVFVWFRIPSMVSGMGVALVFECIAFVFTDGEGLRFFGVSNLELLSNTVFMFVFCMVVIILMAFLYTRTTFGYHYQAIRSNQKIAFSSGIKVFRNVLICYMLGGILMAVSGVFNTVYTGTMEASMSLSSVSIAFYSIVSVIIAFYYSQYVSLPIAILFVTIGTQALSSCITALGINGSGANAIKMFFLFLFTFVTYMLGQRKHRIMKKARIEQANRQWEEMNAT